MKLYILLAAFLVISLFAGCSIQSSNPTAPANPGIIQNVKDKPLPRG